MKKLTILLAILTFAVCAQAQEIKQWSIAAVWDFRTKTTSAVAMRSIGLIERPFGLHFDLEVDGFAGSDLDSNITGGISIGKTLAVARNVDFKIALAVSVAQNKPTGAGLLFGINYRF